MGTKFLYNNGTGLSKGYADWFSGFISSKLKNRIDREFCLKVDSNRGIRNCGSEVLQTWY